eukprot:6188004-Pleurochrysis_carterae.AAC.5
MTGAESVRSGVGASWSASPSSWPSRPKAPSPQVKQLSPPRDTASTTPAPHATRATPPPSLSTACLSSSLAFPFAFSSQRPACSPSSRPHAAC